MRTFVKYVFQPALVLVFFSMPRINPVLTVGMIVVFVIVRVYISQSSMECGDRFFERGKYEKARREYRRGLKEKNISAAVALGNMLFLGLGGPVDKQAGARVYWEAADLIDHYAVTAPPYSRDMPGSILKPGSTDPFQVDPNYSRQVHIYLLREMLLTLQQDGEMEDEATRVLIVRIRNELSRREATRQ